MPQKSFYGCHCVIEAEGNEALCVFTEILVADYYYGVKFHSSLLLAVSV